MLLRFLILLSLVISTVVSLIVGAFETCKWLWTLPMVAFWTFIALLACLYGYLDLLRRRVDTTKEQDGDDPH